jgi:tRNA threonylcarbamoyladenosine biosynthesis protein TsaB
MKAGWLILETSGRVGQVGVARAGVLLAQRRLDEARRHARDLAPAVAELLSEQGWSAQDLAGVIVSRGPGSYTGLRVGIMSAKTLAYAAGCDLIAVDTFAVIAAQTPPEAERVDVLADAQQDKLYIQSFVRQEACWQASTSLSIVPAPAWLAGRARDAWVSGPGLARVADRLPGDCQQVPDALPGLPSLLRLGMQRHERGERDDIWKVEPLYARASSAEEKWDGLKSM